MRTHQGKTAIASLGAGVIFAGLAPIPLDADASTFERAAWALTFALCSMPLFALMLYLSRRSLPGWAATTFLVATVVFGGPATLLLMVFAGPGAFHVMLYSIGLLSAANGAVLAVGQTTRSRRAGIGFLMTSSVIAGWSLAAVPAVLLGAARIAGDTDACIAAHGRDADPVTSMAGLRGLSLYTTATGYKTTSRWYFHAVLLVDGPYGREAYNWSPRRMRFDRIQNDQRLIVSPMRACDPSEDDLPGARFLSRSARTHAVGDLSSFRS